MADMPNDHTSTVLLYLDIIDTSGAFVEKRKYTEIDWALEQML